MPDRTRRWLRALFLLALAAPARAIHISTSAKFNGTGNGSDRIHDVATDSSQNIYAAGYAFNGNLDAWVGKFDRNMVLLSSFSFNGPGNNTDESQGIDIGPDGNLYIAGEISVTGAGYDLWVAKLSPSLVLLASATLAGSAGTDDIGYDIDVDSSGLVFVAGEVSQTLGGRNAVVAKFDSTLALLSSGTFNGAATSTDVARGVAVSTAGDVYLAGTVRDSTNANAWLAKLDLTLVFKASATLDGSGSVVDEWNEVKVGPDGRPVVVGVTNTGTDPDARTAVYSSALVLASSATLGITSGLGDDAAGVASDSAGNIYVAGHINFDVLAVKYSPALVVIASRVTNGPAAGADQGLGVVVETGDTMLLVGSINVTGSGEDAYLARHDFETTSSLGASAAATLTWAMPGGTASVAVPAGAFASDVQITLQTPASLASPSAGPAALRATGVALEVIVTPALSPSQLVTVTIPYRDADVAGLTEARLVLARYDDGSGFWTPLLSSVNAAANTVTARTDHFSVVQVMESVPSDTVDTVFVFPNPMRPRLGHTAVLFINAPAFARIRLYTAAGEKVADLAASAAGQASWDGRNIHGNKAASGLYYGFATSGTQTRTFKVAVER